MALQSSGKTDGGRARLRADIQSGRFLAGTYLPSVRVLASEMGVSKSSVHNILKLLQEEELVRIYPNCGALVLKNDGEGRQTRLERIFVRPSDFGVYRFFPVTRELLSGVAAGAEKKNCEMTVSFSDSGLLTDQIVARRMRDEFQGVVYLQCRNSGELVAPLRRAGIPCVVASAEYGDPGTAHCRVDYRSAAAEAARLLVEHGCRRLGIAMGLRGGNFGGAMLEGFAAGAAAAGVGFDRKCICSGLNVEHSEDSVRKLVAFLDSPARPDGIFTVRDFRARDLYEAATRLKIQIPEQLSVISFDGHTWPGAEEAGLTVLEEPLRELGENAVELLRAWVGSGREPEPICLNWRLIERRSLRSSQR